MTQATQSVRAQPRIRERRKRRESAPTRVQALPPAVQLGGISAASLISFALLARRVLRRKTWHDDWRMRSRLPRYGKKMKPAAVRFGHLGKEAAVLPAAALLGMWLWRDGSKPGAIAIGGGTSAGVLLSHFFDHALPRRMPPPGRKAPFDPSFPSGHALHSSSLLLTSAYILAREGKVKPTFAASIAVALSAALGVDRLIHDRHWPTDVFAGWLAALSVASAAGAGYEKFRAQPRPVAGSW